MKGLLDRTKVVLRHLPPTISQSDLVEHMDSRFSGRYRWLTFYPGKSRLKYLKYSRAYIDFNKPEDVMEFAESFNGHIFVNEKGTQFKTIVEYAPSQRVPKQWSKKDGREGSILKDPDYLEFLELLAKPVENLPSAEIQLERKEAERAGAPKDVPIVTPLMDYIRQKRAAKGGSRRTMVNGNSTRRFYSIPSRMQASGSSKKGSGKKISTMYVLRENSKGASSKDKSTNLLVRKQDDQLLRDKSVNLAAVSRSDALEGKSGGSESTEMGKKKILLLKSKGKEMSNDSSGSSLQHDATSHARISRASAPPKQNQQREINGRIVKSILLNRDTRSNQPSSGYQSEQRTYPSNRDKDRKPPRPPSVQSFQKDTNGFPQDKLVNNDLRTIHTEKHERQTRNKDRPDISVWTPLRRSDGSHTSDESLPQVPDSAEGSHVDMKHEMLVTHGGEGVRGSHISDNGYYSYGGRRGSAYSIKNADGSSVVEGKLLKRGVGSEYGSNEKRVWVQKSSSGS